MRSFVLFLALVYAGFYFGHKQNSVKIAATEDNAYYVTQHEKNYIDSVLWQRAKSTNRTTGDFSIILPDGREIKLNTSPKGKGMCTQPDKPIKVIQTN